jgi:transposase
VQGVQPGRVRDTPCPGRPGGWDRAPVPVDAIKRFNAEGITGLVDQPNGHRRERLSEAEQAILVNRILRGPDPDWNEPCAWTLPDPWRFIEARFVKTMAPQSMSRVVRRLGLSRQKARPVHPQKNPKAAEAFQKRGLLAALLIPARISEASTWTISPLAMLATTLACTVRWKMWRKHPAPQRLRMRVSVEWSGSASCRP